MSIPSDTLRKPALLISHTAGMAHLVALPIWLGALIQHYGYNPGRAGILVSLFLVGVVLASVVVARRFDRMPLRHASALGFGLAAAAHWIAASQPVSAGRMLPLASLHVIAGLGVGVALSCTHGCIGRSNNPHGLFASAGMALSAFAVMLLGILPRFMQATSPAVIFQVFAAMTGFGAVVAAVAFPIMVGGPAAPTRDRAIAIPKPAWLVMVALVCMMVNQAMVFSFVEQIGIERGFAVESVNGVLLATAVVNLFPALLAALLQKRLRALHVALVAPVLQGALALVVTSSTQFVPYALAASVYVATMIFADIFLFGLAARLDSSGRAVAATPAMMMLGSAIGPALGGAIAQGMGYAGIGWACVVITLATVATTLGVGRALSRESPPGANLGRAGVSSS